MSLASHDLPLDDLPRLFAMARARRDGLYGDIITHSRNVFIPLTKLCRDVCHYCTFAQTPRRGGRAYLTLEEVLAIARAGADAGCTEALFTLGDKPELRYRSARAELEALGFSSTLDYLHAAAGLVLRETGLLPHLNPGIVVREDFTALREVSASMGLMLETTSARLSDRGGPHFGSPDKSPETRLAMLEDAGLASVPFTTGLLVGIGETLAERIETISAIRDSHRRHGHIQEVIVQNFRAKPGTRMSNAPEPSLETLMWTIAVARLMLPDEVSIQAPPNLSPNCLEVLIAAGIDDWGGISPVTPDHVNPEAGWPELARLERDTARAGKGLAERLAVYPRFSGRPDRWLAPAVARRVRDLADAQGLAREDCGWRAGSAQRMPPPRLAPRRDTPHLSAILSRAAASETLTAAEIACLFAARGHAAEEVAAAADDMRRRQSGDVVRYVVNRNINYTNVCAYACAFCAFSKGGGARALRGRPYDIELPEIGRRVREAGDRGATEICMQGGIHPGYSGHTYLALLGAAKGAAPSMHIHAFSPLEIVHGAETLGMPIEAYLSRLRDAGLGSLPGTAAEILHDDIRAVICPDKLDTGAWLGVIETAHRIGLRTTATIMFGHVDGYEHWAAHLIAVRDLQRRTGGFTEFVPLPFVAAEAPIYRKGQARAGPSWREVTLMHAVARLTLGPWIPNIQVSWVKLGEDGAARMLAAGANDLGGTLMNESISRAAGASHGQEFEPARMEALIRAAGRVPVQRTTLYRPVDLAAHERALRPAPLSEPVFHLAGKHAAAGRHAGRAIR